MGIWECVTNLQVGSTAGMAHPAFELKSNPLYVKAMLFHRYVQVVVFDLRERREFSLADQLDRSARAVKNSVSEAQSSESRKDFCHKLKIASKELHESTAMIASEAFVSELFSHYQPVLLDLAYELTRLLGKSIATARKNQGNTSNRL